MMPITVLTPLHHGTVSGRPSAGDSWRTTAATEPTTRAVATRVSPGMGRRLEANEATAMEASATRMRTRPNRTRLLGPGHRPAGLPRGRVRAPGRRRVPHRRLPRHPGNGGGWGRDHPPAPPGPVPAPRRPGGPPLAGHGLHRQAVAAIRRGDQ